MGSRERSILVSLLLIIFIIGGYFLTQMTSLLADHADHPQDLMGLLGPVLLFVVLQIIIQATMAAVQREDSDERDRLIALVGYRYSYWGLWLALSMLVLLSAKGFFTTELSITPVLAANAVLFLVAVADGVGLLGQLWHYRMGVRA
jgi:hypothetical protein